VDGPRIRVRRARREGGFSALVGALLLAAGCGGGEPAPRTAADQEATEPGAPAGNGMGVESEIGALDQDKAQQTFERATQQLFRCFSKGVQRIPFLGGEIRFKVRVTQEGTTRWAFVKESTLGDHETEACMLAALRSAAWPKPVGGEGLAENSFTFEPSSDERPPVGWSPEQLGEPFKKARGELSACHQKTGGGALRATLYVDTDGKALGVGVASADERGEGAIPCVVDVLRGITYPSPGSYAAKVSIDLD
jgi:hypothetical protein